MKNHTQLREEFIKFCNTDNFSAPPYEYDTIINFFLTKQSEAQAELVRKVEGLKYRNTAHLFEGEKRELTNELVDVVLSLITPPDDPKPYRRRGDEN